MNEDEYILVNDLQRVRQIQLLVAAISPAGRKRLATVESVSYVVEGWENHLYTDVTRALTCHPANRPD